MTKTVKITPLNDAQLDGWLDANIASRGQAHLERLMRFWQQVQDGKRVIWAAWEGDAFLGHITLQYTSEYPPFKRGRIPEIVDVWVEEKARKKGVGRKLLKRVIREARKMKSPAVGMGVGVTFSYGAAHRLYATEGFMPDGSGLWVQGYQAEETETIKLGYDAVLMWIKPL